MNKEHPLSSNSSGSETEVQSCSKHCVKTYEKLQKRFDEQRQTLSKANLEIIAYQLGLESVEAQLIVHQKNEVVYEEKSQEIKKTKEVKHLTTKKEEIRTVDVATTGVSTASAPVTTAGVAISTVEPRTSPTTTTVFDDEDVTMAMTRALIPLVKSQ
ncbi:hypothetical protein Tco_0792180 [Tanacetum coccineum]